MRFLMKSIKEVKEKIIQKLAKMYFKRMEKDLEKNGTDWGIIEEDD